MVQECLDKCAKLGLRIGFLLRNLSRLKLNSLRKCIQNKRLHLEISSSRNNGRGYLVK